MDGYCNAAPSTYPANINEENAESCAGYGSSGRTKEDILSRQAQKFMNARQFTEAIRLFSKVRFSLFSL